MANSLITRCPKCSTAFRVSDEVLSMAKGKVRCGQCFNIFDASKFAKDKDKDITGNKENPSTSSKTAKTDVTPTSSKKASKTENTSKPIISTTSDEETINPEWLHSLFEDKDLHPVEETHNKVKHNPSHSTVPNPPRNTKKEPNVEQINEPAPWEVELAEVEAALKTVVKKPTLKPTPTTPTPDKKAIIQTAPKPPTDKDPDYMVALQSLAQTASEQTRPSSIESQHNILEQLSAQESLAPLLEDHGTSMEQKNAHPWLWFLGVLLGLALLISQALIHFFDEASRSENFRPIYRTVCSYYNCVLPQFEDVSTITIQHVRIQSHPSIKNTLLVNAIITNISSFSQPMPKIALEFFDLNGSPVAARLFSPRNYLDKDFLDITYMPPNTPIHLVIPIQDPGARAVTHQLKAFTSDTRSY